MIYLDLLLDPGLYCCFKSCLPVLDKPCTMPLHVSALYMCYLKVWQHGKGGVEAWVRDLNSCEQIVNPTAYASESDLQMIHILSGLTNPEIHA